MNNKTKTNRLAEQNGRKGVFPGKATWKGGLELLLMIILHQMICLFMLILEVFDS